MIGWFVLLVAGVVVYRLLLARIRGLEDTLADQRRTIEDLARRLETVSRLQPSAAQPQPATAPPRPIAMPAIPQPTQAADAPRVEKPKVVAPPPIVHAPPPVLRESPPISAPGRRSDLGREGGPPPPPLTPPAAPRVPFDWENVIGVKLFSAIAGIALVLAAVFFLRYSIDRGWLSPPVRMAIGIIVAVALLVVCELKAARKYAVTANALDAAAIAILFATFFAAHSLWNLIPAVATFVLLALVTVVAVLLSIRRESMFIAVLGLVGGFATPALLSTGENRPIPLFTYLLLLNVGLAWVASRRKWPLLTMLSIVLTALYQWGWVLRFLSGSQLSLAMGIFLIFSIASFFALSFRARSDNDTMETTLDRGGLTASAMPLVFAAYVAAVPGYGAHAGLLFGFLFLIDAAMLAIGLARSSGTEVALHTGNLRPHIAAAGATLLVFAIWLANSYARGAWTTAIAFVALFVAFYLFAPLVAARVKRPFGPIAVRSTYAAPLLLFVFPVIAGIEPAVAAPGLLFGTLFGLLALIAWRALAAPDSLLYFIAAFFAVAAEATWSATFLSADTLGRGIALYVAFGVFYLGVPILARRIGRRLEPAWGAGAVLIASLVLLLFVATGLHSPAALWGLALLLAILDAGLFLESASVGLPVLSAVGGMLSWVVLAVWWGESAAAVGLLPSLLVVTGLTLLMLGGHAWASRQASASTWRPPLGGPEVRLKPDAPGAISFRQGVYLAFVGHFFLFFIAVNPEWSAPPWPMLGALTVMTLAASAASLAARAPALHATGVIAAALVTLGWTLASAGDDWSKVALVTIEAVLAYGLAWLAIARRAHGETAAAAKGLTASAFIAQFACLGLIAASATLPLAAVTAVLVVNAVLTLALAWRYRWDLVAPAAVAPAWLATMMWLIRHSRREEWIGGLMLATALYATFVAYPFVLNRRAKDTRAPYLTAVLASALFFIAAYAAFDQGGRLALVGLIPLVQGAVLALLMRQLLVLQPAGERDLGRLATVAGAALAFATVAIPLQLRNQWITIGWALEGAALSWLYRRIPHRGLLYSASALLAAVFVRLALNPSIFVYEPRGMRIFNWYLYTYLLSAIAMFLAAWWLTGTDDRLGKTVLRMAKLLPAGGGILLFLLLNIEIADFYSTGREIMFRFGVTLAQDLTYTIGWLIFGLAMLMSGIYLKSRAGRVTAVALIAITTCKAFLYDMGSLGGLYRVGALVGLAISLSLVALALQKFVLQAPKEA